MNRLNVFQQLIFQHRIFANDYIGGLVSRRMFAPRSQTEPTFHPIPFLEHGNHQAPNYTRGDHGGHDGNAVGGA
ncbi:MAG: hypothetical protein U0905_14545 [Pirellulales bacterium]